MAVQARLVLSKSFKEFPLEGLTWTSSEDLVAVAEESLAVQHCERENFHEINVEQTFQDLVQCGGLLQVALTAAGNQPCSKPILAIMNAYQDVLVDCVDASGSFVDACVASLKQHKLVKRALEKSKLEMAFRMYGKCADLADKMAGVAGKLADKVELLTIKATEGLLAAKDDMNLSQKAKDDADKLLRQLKAEQAGLIDKLESLAKELDEVKEEETKFAKQASSQRDRAFAMAIVGAVVGGLTSMVGMGGGGLGPKGGGEGGHPTGSPSSGHQAESARLQDLARDASSCVQQTREKLNALKETETKDVEKNSEIEKLEETLKEQETQLEQAKSATSAAAARCANHPESLEAKEAAATARKRELNTMERDQKARMKQSVAEMEGMTEQKTQIEQTLLCLSVTLQTMGRVKTTFCTVQLFWRAVAKQCKVLAAMKDTLADEWKLADDDEKELDPFGVIVDSFMESAVRWAAVGSVNLKAHKNMVEAKNSVDEKMCALPDGKACAAEVNRLARELKVSLEDAVLDPSPSAETGRGLKRALPAPLAVPGSADAAGLNP